MADTTQTSVASKAIATKAQASISDLHPLHQAYINGNLITRVTNDNGNKKVTSFNRIGKYLTLPLEELIKPFNFSIGDLKYKYQCTLMQWDSETVTVLFEEREIYKGKPDSFILYMELEGKRYKVTKVTDKSGIQIESPYAHALYRPVLQRLVGASFNMPLMAMVKSGQVSQKQLAIILYSYIRHKSDKEDILLDKETANVLGQILFTKLNEQPNADVYTPKEFLENYFQINWGLVKDASAQKRQDTKLLQMPI